MPKLQSRMCKIATYCTKRMFMSKLARDYVLLGNVTQLFEIYNNLSFELLRQRHIRYPRLLILDMSQSL